VLFMLWHLAGRWGQVTLDGIRLRLHLTHASLGQLIAAKRPTVSLAVRRLQDKGCVRRTADGAWLITSRGQSLVTALARTDPAAPAVATGGGAMVAHAGARVSAAAPAAPPRAGRGRPRTRSGAPARGR
jgi:CRP/FNR family transcriptional regulator, cyclic AMP receptor protein